MERAPRRKTDCGATSASVLLQALCLKAEGSCSRWEDQARQALHSSGSGAAGYTAAILLPAARAGPNPDPRHPAGGQLPSTEVENYPASQTSSGAMADWRQSRAGEHVGPKLVSDHVQQVDLAQRTFRLGVRGRRPYLATASFVRDRAQARWLELLCEQKIQGLRRSACATCDGFSLAARRYW